MGKIKARIKKTVDREVEIDVCFPIYRKHDLLLDRDDVVIYAKTIKKNGEFITYSIKESNSTDYEIEIKKSGDLCSGSSYEYCLGKNDYESNEQEFVSVIFRMKKKIEEAHAILP